MAKTAAPDDGNPLARVELDIVDAVVGSHTGAKQRRGFAGG